MRKVIFNMNEKEKYEIIKSLVEHNGNKDRAAIKLGCTKRHVNRFIQKYKQFGESAFVHGNKGRKPAHTISEQMKTEIITLYNNKYWDATFSYACELLEQHDGISISPSTLTNILHQQFILSPRTTKKTKKRMTALLQKKSNQVEHDTFTQFSYACHPFGVELKTTSIAQAKGRVERAFQTLQQRLPIAMRLAGINEISQANVFLNSYIKVYNAKFALPRHSIKSVFEAQPELEKIHHTLAVLTERVVDNGHCIRFQKNYYKTMNAHGLQTHFHRGTKGLVIRTFDGQLLFSTNDQVYELEFVPTHESISKDFDIQPAKKT